MSSLELIIYASNWESFVKSSGGRDSYKLQKSVHFVVSSSGLTEHDARKRVGAKTSERL